MVHRMLLRSGLAPNLTKRRPATRSRSNRMPHHAIPALGQGNRPCDEPRGIVRSDGENRCDWPLKTPPGRRRQELCRMARGHISYRDTAPQCSTCAHRFHRRRIVSRNRTVAARAKMPGTSSPSESGTRRGTGFALHNAKSRSNRHEEPRFRSEIFRITKPAILKSRGSAATRESPTGLANDVFASPEQMTIGRDRARESTAPQRPGT